MKVSLNIADNSWEGSIDNPQKFIESIIDAAFVYLANENLNLPSASKEVSFLLTDDQEIQHLNKHYRNKDKATNVLSFSYHAMDYLGDIALSYGTIRREAREQNKPFKNHLAHLIVHGFLHLIGYDHQGEDEADLMEKAETEILKTLKILNPYK
jgi:probable rRNA maturation factor